MSDDDDNTVRITVRELFDRGYATQTKIGKMIGAGQPYVNRKMKVDFGIIFKPVGTYENSEAVLRKSKTKLLK